MTAIQPDALGALPLWKEEEPWNNAHVLLQRSSVELN
jgi:hypothetical protein